MKLQNNSLLMISLYRYNEGQAFWKEVIQQMYGRTSNGALMKSQILLELEFGELLGPYGHP